jgi:hypothetical protein
VLRKQHLRLVETLLALDSTLRLTLLLDGLAVVVVVVGMDDTQVLL